MTMKRSKQQEKKPSRLSLALKITLILAASLLICVTTYGMYLTKKVEHAAEQAYEPVEKRGETSTKRPTEVKVEPVQDNVSVLFIGIDDSDQRGQGAEGSRSDALLLATLNRTTKTVKLLSIPRDSYVYVPHVGYKDKITHAHAFGGTLATIETVEELFDIPVDYYVRMNFNAFIDVVDALGGIEAEVPYAMLEKDEFDRNTVRLQPGLQHLNGREALALARTRKLDSDMERGKRQQEILKAIAQQAASISSITKYDELIDAVGANMKTNMTFKEMKGFFSYLTQGVPRIDSLTIEGYDDMSTGIYYYQLEEQSLNETKEILKSHLGLTEGDINTSNGSSLAGSGSEQTQSESSTSSDQQ
ncbi:LCP family protein [Metasolibacillus meyeri]|uniref:LCP family protein n=1 Tax=Metasolibacillus meyeri TaxID=1071052 RepID=A0AAW9NZM3_9BACL|nr:LCP family protein [Metasolibacillus meyeri]MEC1180850.1 LCP family protein [Metasolibacillus meyeri]